MILKTNDDVLGRIQELFTECLEKKEFGEFSVTVTMNHGKPVRLQKSDRENLVRYSNEKLIVEESNITTAWVPGAFEIPVVAQKMASSGKYDAVICLGAVIRGSTTHYDYVCNEVSKGCAQVSMNTGIPCLFGVVTTENIF